MRKPSHLRLKLLILSLCGCLLAVWLYCDFHCILRDITGIICPTCGMTRAWKSVLQLDFQNAFFYHPMFWSVPVLIGYLIYDAKLFRDRKLNNWVLFLLITLFVLCYLIRLIVFLDGNLTI